MSSRIADVVVSELLRTATDRSFETLERCDLLSRDLAEFDLDSLDKLEVVMTLEDVLNIVLPEEGLEQCLTVSQLVDYCERHVEAANIGNSSTSE